MLKVYIVSAFVLLMMNCMGQNQCLCTFGYPPQTCSPDSIIDLPSGLQLAICGNIIHTKGGVLFTDLSLTYCEDMNGIQNNRNVELALMNRATDTVQLIVDHDTLSIIQMIWLPNAEDFNFTLVPYLYTDYFRLIINEPPYVKYALEMHLLRNNIPLYSDSKLQKVWHVYEEMKSLNSAADKHLVGLLFMAAISGSEDLEHKLMALKEDFAMDNGTRYYYNDLIDLLPLWKNKKE